MTKSTKFAASGVGIMIGATIFKEVLVSFGASRIAATIIALAIMIPLLLLLLKKH